VKANPTTRIFWAVAVAVVLIAFGSFSLSFLALKDLATQNGTPAHLAFIWPLIVDVSVIVFTAAILVSQLQRRGAKLAIALTGFYAVVTIVGNVLHAPDTWLGWFVAILPPLSLIFATEMLRAMAHHNILLHGKVNTLAEVTKAMGNARRELDNLNQTIDVKNRELDKLIEQQRGTDAHNQDKNPAFVTGDPAALALANEAKQGKVAERRQQVLSLLEAGYDKNDIAGELDVSVRTIARDIKSLNGQVKR
jgi:hypothetical protein